MSRPFKLVPADFANGDFCRVLVTVEKKPQLEFIINEGTGELVPRIKNRTNPKMANLPLLIDPNGLNVVPANLYLRYKATHTDELTTLDTHHRALKAFYRYLWQERKTIYDLDSEPEQGVVYQFRDHLIDELKYEVLDKYGNTLLDRDDDPIVLGSISPSTGSTYILVIVDFYNFLHVERIIKINDKCCPFVYKTKRVRLNKHNYDHDLLGHIKRGERVIEIKTTELTKPFGRTQPLQSSHKLTPMLEDEKRAFYDELSYEDTNFKSHNDIKDLMLYTATEVGLRIKELVTFPSSVVRLPKPHEESIRVSIGKTLNGCMTKFNKQRTIEIPRNVMTILYQYKTSDTRRKHYDKALVTHNALFINPDNGLAFSPNTIEKHLGTIRRNIIRDYNERNIKDEWYFTIHDLRATFATHWLYEQHIKTGKIFDVLIDDLKEIMGHSDTTVTKKYIEYMKNETYWLEFAQRKNMYVSSLTG